MSIFDLLPEPKPRNSGMESAEGFDVGGSIVEEDEAGGVIGGGERTLLALVDDNRVFDS